MTRSQDPDESPLPPGVGRTALGVAAVRARESLREDRLFDDPYAAAFLRAAHPAPERADPQDLDPQDPDDARAAMARHIVLRTRFFDDYLDQAAEDGIPQTVLLAAGLDTRAFRLDWPPDHRLFEIDLPDSLAFKERVLTDLCARPRCRRTVIPADLTEDWPTPLRSAGFDLRLRTAWLIEGLLIYLGPESSAALLETVGRLSAPGSRLSLVRGGVGDTLARALRSEAMTPATALWRGGLGTDPASWLDRHGWTVRPYDQPALRTAYGSARPEIAASGTTFLIAERAQARRGRRT